MEIIYNKNFIKLYKKLPKEIKDIFIKKELIFKNNIFDTSLKTHKLHGKFSNHYSFSINYKYRAIFNILENNNIEFIFIGGHEIYNKIFDQNITL